LPYINGGNTENSALITGGICKTYSKSEKESFSECGNTSTANHNQPEDCLPRPCLSLPPHLPTKIPLWPFTHIGVLNK